MTINYEPPFDKPNTSDYNDLLNFGYGGYGDALHVDVNEIEDVRMLVNYYSFLNTEECKSTYQKVERNYEMSLWRATARLLSVIGNSKLCQHIPVHLGRSELISTASQVALILEDNAYYRGSNAMNYDYVRIEINNLVADLKFYFYAHIDSLLKSK